MKKFAILTLFILSLSSCTSDKNLSSLESKSSSNSNENSLTKKQDLTILGAKVLGEASDKIIIDYFKSYYILSSQTASANEKSEAMAKLIQAYYKALQEWEASKNSQDKLELCNNKLIIDDLTSLNFDNSSLSNSNESFHNALFKIFKLPPHRAACVLRFLNKVGIKTLESTK